MPFRSRVQLGLAVIAFLADIAGLASIAYSTVVHGQTEELTLQLFYLVLAFLLGLFLGYSGLSGKYEHAVYRTLHIYLWAYLLLACAAYLAVILAFRREPGPLYWDYALVVAAPLLGFGILWSVTRIGDLGNYAVTMLAVAVVNLVLIIISFTTTFIPQSASLYWELFFWFSWTLIAAALLVMSFRSSQSYRGRSLRRYTQDT